MSRATAGVDCSECSYEYFVSKYNVKNIGLPWQAVWGSYCPLCNHLNINHVEEREFFQNSSLKTEYDKASTELVTIIQKNDLEKISSLIYKIKNKKVPEAYIQQYVNDNPEKFGLENLQGPFPQGPDFKAVWNGEEVEIEVERAYTDYKSHQHHHNWSFRKVSILICLDSKQPTKRSREGLPQNIWYIDQQHFLEWYAEYIEKQIHSETLLSLHHLTENWFTSRFNEELFDSEEDWSMELETNTMINEISSEMAFHFLVPYLPQIHHPDFSLSDIEPLKLLEFYVLHKDEYINRIC
ncbi:hypothetical protein [Metabacillus fastidiosus]|uniref:Uncharacterized protein n=1 Tax=Metabacillus fastidiosus TaxID=1458 RepID=A0ABU6NTI9_9BACI|nr:hypothetical protein [Metabacillus fastidiosus]MED4400321.1 hypothetical protein [Metabacillus fastidiosus]